MEKVKYVVTHREYTHDGEFIRSFSLPQEKLEDAVHDASLVVLCYTATEEMAAVHPCNVTVRGSKGRFVKWRNK